MLRQASIGEHLPRSWEVTAREENLAYSISDADTLLLVQIELPTHDFSSASSKAYEFLLAAGCHCLAVSAAAGPHDSGSGARDGLEVSRHGSRTRGNLATGRLRRLEVEVGTSAAGFRRNDHHD